MSKPTSRNKLIEAITAPLGFFVLALLIVEGFLSIALVGTNLEANDKVIGMYLGVGLFIIVIGFVFTLVWFKPRNLTFDKEAHLVTDANGSVYDHVNQIDKPPVMMDYKERVLKKIDCLPSVIKHEYAITSGESAKKDALVIVDVQNDFFAGGSLPVPEADTLIDPLNDALRIAEKSGLLIVFTQDWHPITHSSFKENGGDWKPHCVMETTGAAIHSGVHIPKEAKYVRFGVEEQLDGYTPFENPLMDKLINTPEIRRVYVAGIALEYCVYATCKQIRERNKEVIAVESLIRAATPIGANKVWIKLNTFGVKRVHIFALA